MIDRFDVLSLVGLLLLGSAFWLWWGLPAVLAYAGVALLILGFTGGFVKAYAATHNMRLAPPPDKQ